MSENAVFISYRRSVSSFIARAVFQNLRYHGYDVFMDVESIDSGAFDTIILNQIAARPHFLVILTPGAVERCAEPGDWLRREIEEAIHLERNIVPLLVNNFAFNKAAPYLTGRLAGLSRYNALNIPHDFFEEAMERLRTRFLREPAARIRVTPTPTSEQPIVHQKITTAQGQPEPTETQLDSEGYYDQGHQKWARGDYAGAIADCTKAIELNPAFAEAYNRRGTAYLALDDYDQATADFQKAIELSDDNPAPHFNLGLVAAAQGDYKRAKGYYEDALHINPTFAQAYYSRAVARTALEDYRGAVGDYNIYLDLGGGDAFKNADEVKETIKTLRKRFES